MKPDGSWILTIIPSLVSCKMRCRRSAKPSSFRFSKRLETEKGADREPRLFSSQGLIINIRLHHPSGKECLRRHRPTGIPAAVSDAVVLRQRSIASRILPAIDAANWSPAAQVSPPAHYLLLIRIARSHFQPRDRLEKNDPRYPRRHSSCSPRTVTLFFLFVISGSL